MLFKELKNIINEDEEKTPQTPEPVQVTSNQNNVAGVKQPENNEPIKRKPLKTLVDIKNASDGIGKESYKTVNELKTDLKSTLKNEFNVKDVTSSNNVLTVVFDFSEGDKFIVRRTGKTITQQEVTSHIQMRINSILDTKLDDFEIETTYIGGLLNFTIKSKNQKETD